MPVRTEFLQRIPLRVYEVVGSVSFEEVRTAVRAVYDDSSCPLDVPVLWDAADASLEQVRSAEIEEAARFLAQHARHGDGAGRSRVALVARSTIDYGLCRSFEGHMQSLRAPKDVRVFRGREEALSWLLA